jgi:uncharacterized damage-inducible protein DinB
MNMKQGLQSQIAVMKEFFDRSTRVLEEKDSGYAPQEGLFTVSQQVAHAAQTIDWFFQGAFAPAGFDLDFERMDKEVRGTTSLKAAREWFDRAIQAASASVEAHADADWMTPLPEGPIMGGLPRIAIFNALTDHTAHHRGALTVYTRLLGKTPPMPYMET